MNSKTDICYMKSIELLRKISTSHGFHAGFPGYDAVWARDSMIVSLGASLLGESFKKPFRQSLLVLGKHQSSKGQIPNAVDIFSERKPHVDFESIDSTLWFLIGHMAFKKRYRDSSLMKKEMKKISKAFNWLSYQDAEEDFLLEQLPTTDWEDAFPHKYGHTINTQALYYKALVDYGKKKIADLLRERVNKKKDVMLWNGEYYSAWRWKNHNNFHEEGKWFDSFGNILAILFGLADKNKSLKIIDYIRKKKINKPFPVKCLYPTIKKNDKEWHDYFEDCDARDPYSYLNAGIWPYIGAFYVVALLKLGMYREAKSELEKVAEANSLLEWNFSEWIHGENGKPSKGGGQGWNAGAYVFAYECLKRKEVLI